MKFVIACNVDPPSPPKKTLFRVSAKTITCEIIIFEIPTISVMGYLDKNSKTLHKYSRSNIFNGSHEEISCVYFWWGNAHLKMIN